MDSMSSRTYYFKSSQLKSKPTACSITRVSFRVLVVDVSKVPYTLTPTEFDVVHSMIFRELLRNIHVKL